MNRDHLLEIDMDLFCRKCKFLNNRQQSYILRMIVGKLLKLMLIVNFYNEMITICLLQL